MSKSKGQQSSAYRGHEEEVGGSSSSAAVPLPVQDEPCRSGEVLPEYRDGVGGSKQFVGGEDGEGVRGVGRGETEGGVDTDAPPEFEVYVPKMKRIKSVRTGETLIISHDEHLNTDGEALYRWLLEQRSRPPSVCIRIWGTHRGGRKGRKLVTDFDLSCDLTHLLLEQNHIGEPTLATVPPNQRAHRGHGRFKSIAKDLEEGRTVRDWADQYCEDQSALKE
ncbi:unnamed protein product [Tuber melanosporum]|uniref:(Perigord truffle) hypothetical protein n=1 Tax=Tuber melanosporum (strain Mel28) TaxID=656061 RepID=D5GFT8_TUBMM|nr:uncharacterized protein GSTUM_00007070001 [Tuber melanosporum]CAZ83381.1 unnamed protein product [Tuber melanosporum]